MRVRCTCGPTTSCRPRFLRSVVSRRANVRRIHRNPCTGLTNVQLTSDLLIASLRSTLVSFACSLAGALARVRTLYYVPAMNLTVETEREDDGRWIAEVPDLAGVLAYGETRDEAIARAQALALRVLADRLEHAEAGPDLVSVTFRAA